MFSVKESFWNSLFLLKIAFSLLNTYFSWPNNKPLKLVGNKIFEKSIYAIIVVNLVAMVLESEPGKSDAYYNFFYQIELVSIVIFTVEYILRTVEAIKTKTKYNLTFFGIIDLLAIIPFYYLSTLTMDGRFFKNSTLIQSLKNYKP